MGVPLRRAATLACLLTLAVLPAGADAAYPGRNGAIAFTGTDSAGVQTLFVRGAGGTRGLLKGDAVANPAFSPYGRRIAVTREVPDSGRAIWLYNTDGSGGRQLTVSALAGSQATWAPSGQRLAYAAGAHGERTIHVVFANGAGDRALTNGPEDQYAPDWSHHGTVAFVATEPTGADIFTVPSAGGVPRRLTFKPGDDVDPAWGPHGNRIAFVRGRGGIWIMDADGRHAHRVVHIAGGVEQGVTWSPDGTRLLFAAGPARARRIYSVGIDGKGLRPLSLPRSDGRDPDWRSVGHDPVIAAAGDVACAPDGGSFNNGLGTPHFCGEMRTSDLLLRPDLWDILVLGDLQYPDGDLGRFYQSFHPSWGRLKPLLRPVPGNHEYATPGASGYFDYFNGVGVRRGRAGDRTRGGYYSFNVGAWHIVALDSNCAGVPGGCATGSPQQTWLAADLAAHPARCTLAFWHHPLFSSLASDEGRGSKQTVALWQTLFDAGADVVLSGHQHFYERMQPMDAQGDLDLNRGIESFVVGTGGKSIDHADFRAANSAVFNATTFGVLKLTLHADSYTWRFHPASAEPFTDAGSADCH
ncbi:MAG: hypothetical protein JWM71_1838 [Solirubrobacteraceae bacterium]|nr:hypothetical protein [Solirubrobacteraceae bacterium]